MVVPIRAGEQIEIGTPRSLLQTQILLIRGWRTYDVARDGQFVVISADNPDDQGSAVPMALQNWTEELRRRVPVD
jgi:hypothetical protein